MPLNLFEVSTFLALLLVTNHLMIVVYSYFLELVGKRLRGVVKPILAFAVFCIFIAYFICVLTLPLIGSTQIEEWFSTNALNTNIYFCVIGLTFVPALVFFKRRKIERLRKYGFFKSR